MNALAHWESLARPAGAEPSWLAVDKLWAGRGRGLTPLPDRSPPSSPFWEEPFTAPSGLAILDRRDEGSRPVYWGFSVGCNDRRKRLGWVMLPGFMQSLSQAMTD